MERKYPKNSDAAKKLIERLTKNVKSNELKLLGKVIFISNILIHIQEDNKTIALSTSKTNYNDPRISVAWCKKYEVPIEKVFPKALRYFLV